LDKDWQINTTSNALLQSTNYQSITADKGETYQLKAQKAAKLTLTDRHDIEPTGNSIRRHATAKL